MIYEEYREAIHQLAEISKKLILKLDEEGQELFEEYCNLYEQVAAYEALIRIKTRN